MAYPFKTAKPEQGRPGFDSVSLAMVTDPTHATQCSLRMKLYDSAARTTLVDTSDTAVSSSGSVRERLVCVISGGLSGDTTYYPTLEYEEVASSGTWVEITDVTDDVTITTQPGPANNEFRLAVGTDPHVGLPSLDGTGDATAVQLRTRYDNCVSAMAAFAPHLVLFGGDQMPNTARYFTEQESLDWWDLYHVANAPLNDICPSVWIRGNHDDVDGFAEDDGGYTPTVTNSRLLYALNPSASDSAEQYGIFSNGIANCVFTETISQSDYNIKELDEERDLSSTQLALVLSTISNNTKPWLIWANHDCLGVGYYGWMGGQKRIQASEQSETIHNALVAHMAANTDIVGIIVLSGHTHRFEHNIRDGIHYINAGTMSRTFRNQHNDALMVTTGHFVDTDGTWPVSMRWQSVNEEMGFVRMTLTNEWGEIEFVRTTQEDGWDSDPQADNTVIHRAIPTGTVIGNNARFFAGKTGESSKFWVGRGW